MNVHVKVAPMVPATVACFPAVYALMERSFPVTEFRSFEAQRSLLEGERYHLEVEARPSGELEALLAWWALPTVRFLEHLAVCPESRGKGLGRRLLREFLGRSSSPVLLEVEPPTTELARRRLEFYQREDFRLLDIDYTQPPMRPGQSQLPLRLMAFPSSSTEKEGLAWLEALRCYVY